MKRLVVPLVLVAGGPAFVDRHGLTTPTVLFDEGMR